MAKKFGKFLLFTAAVGTAAVAAYYFMQKKDSAMAVSDDSDDDYDDFSDDLDDEGDSSRTYVSLNLDNAAPEEAKEEAEFTPLADQVAKQSEDTAPETVEEFFDEEDDSDAEPPIGDN